MGWETLAWCEINPFRQKILNHHFPNAIGYEDIKTTDFSPWNGRIDILAGGFPCQPFSQAGSRKGKSDNRYLWPEMLRAVREIQPSFIMGENVRGIVTMQRGLVFKQIQADLEAEGYEVCNFILPSSGINAPHERERLFIVAHSKRNDDFRKRLRKTEPKKIETQIEENQRERIWDEFARNGKQGHASETKTSAYDWGNFPTKFTVLGGNDGIPGQLDRRCNELAIKAFGDSIVPQLIFRIFTAIQDLKA